MQPAKKKSKQIMTDCTYASNENKGKQPAYNARQDSSNITSQRTDKPLNNAVSSHTATKKRQYLPEPQPLNTT